MGWVSSTKAGTHFLQPGLELLTVFDELGDQVDIAIDPFAAVRTLAQAAVIGLEDVQVQRGEERELVFRNARVQLRLRPVPDRPESLLFSSLRTGR